MPILKNCCSVEAKGKNIAKVTMSTIAAMTDYKENYKYLTAQLETTSPSCPCSSAIPCDKDHANEVPGRPVYKVVVQVFKEKMMVIPADSLSCVIEHRPQSS